MTGYCAYVRSFRGIRLTFKLCEYFVAMYTLKCLRTNTEKVAILLADSLTTRARTLNWSPIPEWTENKPTLSCLNCRIISLFLVSKLDATINCKVILPVNKKGQFICSFQPCFVIDSSFMFSEPWRPRSMNEREWKPHCACKTLISNKG